MMTHSRTLAFCLAIVPLVASSATLEFNRDVRPILSDNCFACHGLDQKNRKADLRLDLPNEAIVARDLAKSEAWSRIITKDEDDLMPPPDSHKKLTPAQKDTLKQWISEGASYQKHWAFEPITKKPAPANGAKNPIDSFIQAELAKHNAKPAPKAAPHELIRRLSLDLTGLPPTPELIQKFDSKISNHQSEIINHLLSQPAYGEHMARFWLDAARYGDTHGLHLDNERSMWPYRDWVVRAFNENLPFDQFTIWQLAGDLLPKPSNDQIIASGFNRCNVTTSEGGSINDEWVHRYAVDRTDTTMSVWMGLTGGCAVCHDHKFDPISQKEFYSLYAFFNSSADPPMDGNILLTQPILRLTKPDQQKELDALNQQIAAKDKAIREALAKLDYIDPATVRPAPAVVTSDDVWFGDDFPKGAKVEVAGAPTRFVTKADGPVHSGKRALQRKADGVAQDFFANGTPMIVPPAGTLSVQCFVDPQDKPKSVMLQFFVGGWNHRAVWGDEGSIPFGQVRTTERVQMGRLPKAGEWVKLDVPIAKIGLKPGMKVTGFAFTQFGGTVTWDQLKMSSRVDPAKDPQWSWSTWIATSQGKRVEALPGDLRDVVRGTQPEKWTPDQKKRLKQWWLETEYQGAQKLLESPRGEKLALEGKRQALETAIPATLVMKDLEKPRDAFVMMRGQYDKPGEKVTRGVPAVFPPLPKQDSYNRLDLAKWLLSPQNPLTARVIVNRVWQQFFGTGIVETANDFGSQGRNPSHPELLDFLAADFRDHGWDMQRLVKMIVTSDTYQQSAGRSGQSDLAALLGHFPRRRLDGEVLRDQALFVSGLLDATIGGKPARPYQPDNIWEPVAYSGSNTRNYVRDGSGGLYRRSLYTFYKRTAPPPSMTIFDAPSREQSCLRRERSNTPMQALNLMNDIQQVEAARHFAQRALLEAKADTAARVQFLFRRTLARDASTQELSIITAALDQHQAKYRAQPEAAKQLIGFGESKAKAGVDAADLAAWTLIASLVLNMDEALCN